MKKLLLITTVVLTLLFTQTLSFAYAEGTSINTGNGIQNSLSPVVGLDTNFLTKGLRGDYYSGIDFASYNSFRIDSSINFDWGSNKNPVTGLGHDNFCVRWSGYIIPNYNEAYTFYTKSDDGVRLYINGNLLINDWNTHGQKENSGTVQLIAGQPYTLALEYFQYNGPSSIKLYWSSASQKKEVIPNNRLFTQATKIPISKGSGTGLKGSYYDGMNFDKLKSTRTDKTINLEWNNKTGQKHQPFSIKWIGRVQPLYSDIYTFKTISDDGIRVWVNSQLIIDNWKENNSAVSLGNIQLQAGQMYDIRVDFYENDSWPAKVKLYWLSPNQPLEIIPHNQLYPPPAPQAGTGNGLKAEYYNDNKLSALKTIKIDEDINFDWGNRGLPIDGVAHNNFSVRWTGKIQPLYSEAYTFKTIADDGVRLWINGNMIINDWNAHSAKSNSYKIELIAGQMYDIKIEYFQESGFAKAQLYWSSNSQISQIVSQKQLYSN